MSSLSRSIVRPITLLFALTLLLAACASPAAPAASTPQTAATESAPAGAESTEAESTEAEAAEEAATDEPSAETSSSEEPRVITHVMGEITLPATPQRVVALEWTYAEALLAVGVQPVGVADIAGYNAWVKIPVELSPDVVDVGTRQAPNLEVLASLSPDLIIAPSFRVEGNYDELSAIAPTMVFDNYPTAMTHYENMKETFSAIADLVGKAEEGEAVLAEMETKFAEARAKLEEAGLAGEKFVLVQAYSSDNQAQVRIFTDNALATQVAMQLGLENGWDDDPQPFGFSTVSVEALPALGDLHFFYVVQDDDNVFASSAIAPLWENLEFVKNGHAYPLGGDTWLFGGPYSVELLADIIVQTLLGE